MTNSDQCQLSHRRKVFKTLFSEHLDYLFRLAYRFCQDPTLAEDMVQELAVKLLLRDEDLSQLDYLKAYLTRSLYNTFIDKQRQLNASRVSFMDPQYVDEYNVSEQPTPDKVLETNQALSQLEKCFQLLSDEHRIILTLHDIEGFSLPELSELLEIPLGTLKSRLFRAREKIQQKIDSQEEPFAKQNRLSG